MIRKENAPLMLRQFVLKLSKSKLFTGTGTVSGIFNIFDCYLNGGNWFWIAFYLALLVVMASALPYAFYGAQKSHLNRAPGHTMNQIAEFFLSRKKYEHLALPIIADMQEEYFEAVYQNRIWKARWVRIRGTYSFFAAMGLDRAFAFVSFFIKAWKSVN
jgi:hypothetical protein